MKIGDYVAIIISLMIGVAMPIIWMSTQAVEQENAFVVVKVNNEVVREINLEKADQQFYDFEFGETTGTIEIDNNKVRMLKMSRDICPNQICSETGWIKDTIKPIACLPNRIIVSIEGVSSNLNIDAISY